MASICLPTRNPNQWWVPIVETVHIVKEPIVRPQRLSLRANSILLQNAGNCDIMLDNGFTLTPGQSYMVGNHNELDTVIFDSTVIFLTATAISNPVIQRLEVTTMNSKLSGQGFYIDQPVLNPQ